MRELSFIETGYLCGLLLLSLVLPILLSFRGPRNVAAKKLCMRTVWIGQALGFMAEVGILASASMAPYAAAFGVLGYVGCVFVLLRQCRAVCPE